MNKGLLFVSVVLLFAALPQSGVAAQAGADDAQGVELYFFWSLRCPHCLEARPVVERLAGEYPWLTVHSHEITQSRENALRYIEMAKALGQEARSVPGFIFCDSMMVGFDGSGEMLRTALEACHRQNSGAVEQESAGPAISLPFGGSLDRSSGSLLLVTLAIAALDAFNPCAFFVLLFLLSLLVNSRSRGRMLYIGGLFVVISGLIYFFFMAAWLNLFLLVGMQGYLTAAAGAVALAMALINIKDFFLPGRGVSLSIPEEKKPGLFQRMRGLLQANRLLPLTVGTVALAVAANSYELLCTSGLPMVYTRILTLEGLSTLDYYLYLALYNLIYVIPLMIIVLLFSFSLGRRKLQAHEGRLLKLLSGTMMLELGLGLLLAPQLLSSISAVAMAMLVAVLLTLFAGWRMKRG